MRTAVTEMLGIEFPILAFSHCRDVVAAVSRAGGFGVLGVTNHTPASMATELRWLTEECKGAPFGIDVLLPVRHAEKADATTADPIPAEHRAFVDDLLARHGLEPLPAFTGSHRSVGAFEDLVDPEGMAAGLLEVAFDFPIKLVASALGPPSHQLVDAARSNDVLVAALAGKAEHARRHVEAGVDIVVAQGYEAGGHTGEISTMVLVPEVVDAVAPVPVLAAGGIGRGRQVAASLALGAAGVWCGSVWLTTEEAETQPVVKQKFLAASSSDTVRSKARTGKPARQLRSAWTEAWEQPGAPATLPLPTQYAVAEPSLWQAEKAALAGNEEARQLATYFVGQIVGSMNQVKTTRQVVFDMIDELIDATEAMTTKVLADSE